MLLAQNGNFPQRDASNGLPWSDPFVSRCRPPVPRSSSSFRAEFAFRRKGSYRSLSVFVGLPRRRHVPSFACRPPRCSHCFDCFVLRIFLVLIWNLGPPRTLGTFPRVQNRLFSMALSCICFNSAENQSCEVVVYSFRRLVCYCYCRRRRHCCRSPIMSKFRSSWVPKVTTISSALSCFVLFVFVFRLASPRFVFLSLCFEPDFQRFQFTLWVVYFLTSFYSHTG